MVAPNPPLQSRGPLGKFAPSQMTKSHRWSLTSWRHPLLRANLGWRLIVSGMRHRILRFRKSIHPVWFSDLEMGPFSGPWENPLFQSGAKASGRAPM